MGVVYGDIGTSVLYAVKECFNPHYGLEPSHSNILGIMSLFFWSLTLVVVVKYLTCVMAADNRGEGGILALLALVTPKFRTGAPSRRLKLITGLGIIGAALLGAEGTITPAISVLSAVEGLEIATPVLKPLVIPITIAILVALFWAQKRGTAGLAKLFAPAMVLWFVTIGALGVPAIMEQQGVLRAVNPYYAIKLLATHGWHGFLVLGAVVLCITGAEALYADMGHFGRKPIRFAWYALVFPALLLNYFGQSALIMERGAEVLKSPFYALAPTQWAIYPMVVLATLAAVIASQALISGSFSLAQQAVQLGFSPRLTIVHTSEETKGQIYIPEINVLLMITCVVLVLVFRSSSSLAAAYGISVMGTMVATSILIYFVAVKRWKWVPWKAGLLVGLFLAIDLPFLLANLPKITDGGWFPVGVCMVVFTIMTTWKRGRQALVKRMSESFFAVKDFVALVHTERPHRVAGSAVFMTGNLRVVPPALRHHYAHNHVLHRQVLLLSIVTEDVPNVPLKEVLEVNPMGEGIYEVVARFGFMQSPKVEKIMRLCRLQYGLEIEEASTTWFLGRDVILTNGPDTMAGWRKTLFTFLSRNSLPATAYFGIPPNRVVEMGMQVSL